MRSLNKAGTGCYKRKKNFFFLFLSASITTASPHQAIFRPLSFIPMEIAFTRGVTGCWMAPHAQLLPESVKRSGSVVFGSQLRICVWAPGDGGARRKVRAEACAPDTAAQMSGTKSAPVSHSRVDSHGNPMDSQIAAQKGVD